MAVEIKVFSEGIRQVLARRLVYNIKPLHPQHIEFNWQFLIFRKESASK